jgi:hypothetical protein
MLVYVEVGGVCSQGKVGYIYSCGTKIRRETSSIDRGDCTYACAYVCAY